MKRPRVEVNLEELDRVLDQARQTPLSESDYAKLKSALHDDTSMRVLHLAREPGDDRTGAFTSGIVSTQQGQRIALYFTGRQHAGKTCATCFGIAPRVWPRRCK